MAETTPATKPAAPPASPPKRKGAKTPAAWAKLVRADLQTAVEGVIRAGQHLIEAKEDVGHGNFDAWVESEVKVIGVRSAERLMQIARHPSLSNPTHVSHLPSAWGTLAELARIPAPALEKKLADGSVFPEMERKDAQKLVRLVNNEQTGMPVSNESHARSNEPRSIPAPSMDFKVCIETLLAIDPEKLTSTTVDLSTMNGDLDLLIDWVERVRKML